MDVLDMLLPLVATSGDLVVRAAVSYLPERSDPAGERWFWSYHVRIENRGDAPVQLLARRWDITDARGAVHVVEGDGVIGQQPVIEPGGAYDYVSGCPLTTAYGQMVGRYIMRDAEGAHFSIAVPTLPLRAGQAVG
jgi:ApaG protein